MMNRVAWVLLAAVLILAPAAAEAQRPAPSPRSEARPAPRGWIGISFKRLEEEGRAVVLDVYPDSPAERAGIQEGDTLVLWNGRRDVGQAVEERLAPGDTVRLRLRRGGGRDRDLTVVAGERSSRLLSRRRDDSGREVIVISPDGLERELRIHGRDLAVQIDSVHRRLQLMLRDSLGPQLRRLEERLPEIWIRSQGARGSGAPLLFDVGRRAVAGAEFAEMNEGLSSYFGTERGVLVLRVAPQTPAARAGLEAGDVVVEADGQRVADIGDVRRALVRSRERDAWALRLKVVRKGKPRDVEVKWE